PSAIHPLSLHDALPISSEAPAPAQEEEREQETGERSLEAPERERRRRGHVASHRPTLRRARGDDFRHDAPPPARRGAAPLGRPEDRKSTRLNSSHVKNS